MGCGASRGTEPVASPTQPVSQTWKPEFTPEDKPWPISNPPESAKTKGLDDGTEQDMPTPFLQEPPVQMVPVLPPPPVTPPAAAKKPLFQTAATTSDFAASPAESTDTTDFFPEQVSLAVGVRQPQQPQQRQSLPQQTTLQPFDLTPASTAPEALPEPAELVPQAAPAPTFLPSPSSRQLQSLPPAAAQQRLLETQLSQQQPRGLQPQRSSARLPPLQSQPQPLTESGPGPLSTSASAPPAPDDPWSSLQSTYRIRESQAAVKSDSTRNRAVGGSGREAGREVLVLGEDDDDFGGGGPAATGLNSTANSALNRSSGYGGRPSLNLPPPQFGSGPKKGGWGSGAMAQAGELMIGEDDWLVKDQPPGGSAAGMAISPPAGQRQQPQAQQQAAVMAYNSRARLVAEQEDRHAPVALKGPAPPAKGKAAEDVMCEDVEDVDTLLEDEMERQGLSNKSLASKLAAYEAQFQDDDD